MSRTTNTTESVKDLFAKKRAILEFVSQGPCRAFERESWLTLYDLNKRQSFPVEDTSPDTPKDKLPSGSNVRCLVCKRLGHHAADCRLRGKRRCFRCNNLGHEAREYWGRSAPMGITKPVVKTSAAVRSPEQFQSEESRQKPGRETSATCSIGADASREATSTPTLPT